MEIGHKIKTLRIAKKIEPIEMADRLNISESTYRRYERNESDISVAVLHRIAIIFGIKAADLLEEDVLLILPLLNFSSENSIRILEKQVEILKQTVNELKDIYNQQKLIL